MPGANFGGLRILSLESRQSVEVAKLIRTYGGEPLAAPAMREISLDSNQPILEFAEALMRGAFDLVIFTTGVGVRSLVKIVSEHYDREKFLEALRSVTIAARGPKSSSALREFGIPIAVVAPEPFTWRSLMSALEAKLGSSLQGMNLAVQEYGTSNPELLTALAEKSISITRILVYQWALPEDIQPLREAVLALAHGHVDVVLFMNAGQVMHLFLMAERMGYTEALHEGFRSTVIGSIGPSTTEGLSVYGLQPDYEPTQSKMGFLISEMAQNAASLLEQKRDAAALHVPSTPPPPVSPLLKSDKSAAPPTKGTLSAVDFLHEIGSRMAASDPLHTVLNRIVDFACSVISCDSCFVYVLEDNQLVLRASKNPHSDVVDHLGIWLGQGITGWVGWHREPVAIPAKALQDPRFKRFPDLPEDTFEAFLSVPILCRSKLVGVINLQHRKPYQHTENEVRLLTSIGHLVGAELERARLETENLQLSDRLESRKHIERAKGVLPFYEGLCLEHFPRFENLAYAVLALGDRHYEHFCKFGSDLDGKLAALGANRICNRVDCDVDVDEPFEQWKSALIPRLNAIAAGQELKKPVPPSESPAGSLAPSATFTRDNPALAPLVDKKDLTHRGSSKATLHLAFSIEGMGIRYEAGDACGVIPQNDVNLVAEILQTLCFNGNEHVKCGKAGTTTLHDALTHHLQITRLSRKIVNEYATRGKCARLLDLLAPDHPAQVEAYIYDRGLIDLLIECPGVVADPADLVAMLPKLTPRLYSISSSPTAHAGEIHTTVAVVRYSSHNRERGGVCSTLFADRAAISDRLPIYIQPNKEFRLPDADAPIVMIGPGTGIAPFRGFLHERRALGAKGRNWLFFGERSAATDYLYREELEAMRADGHLTRLDTAFSRDQENKVYVQHRMLEEAPLFWSWLQDGASVYVCGDASRMAKDVHAALHSIVETQGGMSAQAAEEYVHGLKETRRYHRDVY